MVVCKKAGWFIFILFLHFMTFASDEGWQITATSTDQYFPPVVGNGMIGVLPSASPLQIQRVLLNGFYDIGSGRNHGVVTNYDLMNAPLIDIHLKNLQSNLLRASHNDINDWEQTIHMKYAEVVTSFNLYKTLSVSHRLMALRHLPYNYLTEITITALKDEQLEIFVSVEGKDYLENLENSFHYVSNVPLMSSTVLSPSGKHQITMVNSLMLDDPLILINATNTPYYNNNSFRIDLKQGQTFSFAVLTSLCSSIHYEDHINEAKRFNIFAYLEGKERLIQKHREAWSVLWQGDIMVDSDDPQEQLDIRFSLYNLYSYIRENTSYSIPPMGLYSTGYAGHIFWDAELWMFPPLLLLHPELARSMLEYRFERLEAARRNAMARGYQGAMFPWESALTGFEETPIWALTGPLAHYITAAVGIAFWDYFVATGDMDWLSARAWPVLKEVANFWVSRVDVNESGEYEILNVVGPDEYVEGVDNNAFTNASAIMVLRYAVRAASLLGLQPDTSWLHVADRIPIRAFSDGVTREHETYDGEIIKQADVNLLAFPLAFITDPEQIQKDLTFYTPLVTADGPAMTHGIFSVIASRLGDCVQAYQYFQEAYMPNKRGPFGVLAESQQSNNPYFATGAGAMLQAVLFGFGGLNLDTENGLVLREPCLPPAWRSLTITGVGKDRETIFIGNY